MLKGHFYNQTIKNTVVAIGAMFNNIEIAKYDDAGNMIDQPVKVPLAYASKQTYISKLNEQNNKGNNPVIQQTLPRISFNFAGLQYDASRQRNKLSKHQATTTDGTINVTTRPSPWDFQFDINIYIKDTQDGLQIIEQILPFFSPSYSISIKMMPELDIVEDVVVGLDSVDTSDNWEETLSTGRIIVWKLQLITKSNLYQQIQTNAKVIKKTVVSTYNDASMTSKLETLGIEVIPPTANKTDSYQLLASNS